MRLIQIAAMSENRVIGRDNGLPWHIPEDMKFFRETTKGHACIFGRRTMESLGNKPLPGRLNIVITRSKDYIVEGTEKAPVVVVANFQEALDVCKKHQETYGDDVYICGGGEIYRETLPYTDLILLTVIHQTVDGDTYFPEFKDEEFQLVERRDRTEPVDFSFCTYARR